MRQHTNERAISKYPVMDQRSGRVESREDHQCMGQNFMHLLHIMGEGTILEPWRRNFGQTKQWQGIATRKLKHDASDRNRYQQRIKGIVRDPGEQDPATFPSMCQIRSLPAAETNRLTANVTRATRRARIAIPAEM